MAAKVRMIPIPIQVVVHDAYVVDGVMVGT